MSSARAGCRVVVVDLLCKPRHIPARRLVAQMPSALRRALLQTVARLLPPVSSRRGGLRLTAMPSRYLYLGPICSLRACSAVLAMTESASTNTAPRDPVRAVCRACSGVFCTREQGSRAGSTFHLSQTKSVGDMDEDHRVRVQCLASSRRTHGGHEPKAPENCPSRVACARARERGTRRRLLYR